MSLQGHIVELQRRHEALEKEIEKERTYHRLDEKKLWSSSARNYS